MLRVIHSQPIEALQAPGWPFGCVITCKWLAKIKKGVYFDSPDIDGTGGLRFGMVILPLFSPTPNR